MSVIFFIQYLSLKFNTIDVVSISRVNTKVKFYFHFKFNKNSLYEMFTISYNESPAFLL